VAREFAAWKLCDDCREATKRPRNCSRCGNVIAETHVHKQKLSAEDQLRSELEAEGAYEE
jgi:predicted amidophosphoribosyltransferase